MPYFFPNHLYNFFFHVQVNNDSTNKRKQKTKQHKNFMKISIAAFALLVAGVSSECNNGCNGREGRCVNYEPQYSTPSPTTPLIKIPGAYESTYGYDATKFKKDSCTCFHRLGEVSGMLYAFQAADCSEFTCPYGNSWDAGICGNGDHNTMCRVL